MAAILPTIRETVQNVLLKHTTSQPQECQPQPTQLNSEMEATSLQSIMESANPGISSTFSLSAQEPGISKPVALGIDTKIKAKIWANEYIKFASLLPKSVFDNEDKFKSVEKD